MHENLPLEIAYTVVPLLVVAGLFAVTFVSVEAIDEVDEDAELVVDVLGFQWQWQFAYPASDVSVVGTDDETPELVLPADTSVRFDLTSIDVIHSFWIPGFRFKRDMFPGRDDVVLGRRRLAHRRVPVQRRVRRVLRARPPQDAVLGPRRDARRVRAVAAGAAPTPRRTDHDGHRTDRRA